MSRAGVGRSSGGDRRTTPNAAFLALRVVSAARSLWRALRRLSGDDAYERYLGHHAHAHPGVPALSRREFYISEQQRKWGQINRCC